MNFYANKNGDVNNSGLSWEQAWPIAHALASDNTRIPPGSTLHVTITGVSPYDEISNGIPILSSPENGFEVTLQGRPDAKTTIIFEGEGLGSLPIYRGAQGGSAWVLKDPVLQTYEGIHPVFPRVSSPMGGYFVGIDGKMHPLTFGRYNDLSSIEATTDEYKTDGKYYTGPTVMRQAGGKPLIRLVPPRNEVVNPNPADMKETIGPCFVDPNSPLRPCSVNPDNLDPNNCVLHLFMFQHVFLSVKGSHLIIDGLNVSYAYIGVAIRPGADHVTIRNSTIRGGRHLIACGKANYWKIENTVLDGLMDPEKGHIGWGDVKGGENAPANRNQTACINATEEESGSHGQVTRCIFRDAFDGILYGGPHMQVGGFAEYRVGMTIQEWDAACRDLGNRFERIWDDAHQISHAARYLIHNHNYYIGAGISRDGGPKEYGCGRPLSLCNIFDADSETKLFIFRKGRDVPGQDQWGEGLRHPNALGTHVGNSATSNPFPWIKVNDTEIWGDDNVKSSIFPRLDQAKGLMQSESPLLNLVTDEVNMEFNCIAIDRGTVSDDGPNDYIRPWSYRLDVTTGKDIRDGNLIVNLSGSKTYQKKKTVKTSIGLLPNPMNTVADLRASQAFVDSQIYYPPGIDAKSVELDVTNKSDVLDPNTYVPHHPQAISGAVNIVGLHIPGCFLHRPWRGAMPPAPETPEPRPTDECPRILNEIARLERKLEITTDPWERRRILQQLSRLYDEARENNCSIPQS